MTASRRVWPEQTSRFTERFARYGRTGSVSRIGDIFAPRAQVAFPDLGTDEPALLSSAPYWARLQRLGNAGYGETSVSPRWPIEPKVARSSQRSPGYLTFGQSRSLS